jgi:Ca2+/H+ antiporter
MFEAVHLPLLSRRRFVARMATFLLAALIVDGVALAAGAVGYHFLDGLSWLDASLNATSVMTGNGPLHPPHTADGKLYTLFDALLGVIVFVAVIGVILTPMFHRILHGFHRRHTEHSEQQEEQAVGAGENHPLSAGGRT